MKKCNNQKVFGMAPLNNNANNSCLGGGHKCNSYKWSVQQVQQINQQNFQQNTHLSVAKNKNTKSVNMKPRLKRYSLCAFRQDLSIHTKMPHPGQSHNVVIYMCTYVKHNSLSGGCEFNLLVSFFWCCCERNLIHTASLSYFISHSLSSPSVLFLSSHVQLLNSRKRQHTTCLFE